MRMNWDDFGKMSPDANSVANALYARPKNRWNTSSVNAMPPEEHGSGNCTKENGEPDAELSRLLRIIISESNVPRMEAEMRKTHRKGG